MSVLDRERERGGTIFCVSRCQYREILVSGGEREEAEAEEEKEEEKVAKGNFICTDFSIFSAQRMRKKRDKERERERAIFTIKLHSNTHTNKLTQLTCR